MTEMEELFQGTSKIWAELVKNKDRREFVRRMNVMRDRFQQDNPNFGKAYQNMYKILEGL